MSQGQKYPVPQTANGCRRNWTVAALARLGNQLCREIASFLVHSRNGELSEETAQDIVGAKTGLLDWFLRFISALMDRDELNRNKDRNGNARGQKLARNWGWG